MNSTYLYLNLFSKHPLISKVREEFLRHTRKKGVIIDGFLFVVSGEGGVSYSIHHGQEVPPALRRLPVVSVCIHTEINRSQIKTCQSHLEPLTIENSAGTGVYMFTEDVPCKYHVYLITISLSRKPDVFNLRIPAKTLEAGVYAHQILVP